jgi:hypothetical protein
MPSKPISLLSCCVYLYVASVLAPFYLCCENLQREERRNREQHFIAPFTLRDYFNIIPAMLIIQSCESSKQPQQFNCIHVHQLIHNSIGVFHLVNFFWEKLSFFFFENWSQKNWETNSWGTCINMHINSCISISLLLRDYSYCSTRMERMGWFRFCFVHQLCYKCQPI